MNKLLTCKDGSKIAYQQVTRQSINPGVVFLGGFMSDMTGTKASFIDSVCEEWNCSYVRFDYFGHGASEGTIEQGSIGRWLEDVLLVIDQLTKGPQIFIGSSMGGWLMVLAALKRQERVAGLIGIAAAPDFLEDFARLSPEQREALETTGVCYIPSQYGDMPYPITQHMIEEGQVHRVLGKDLPITCSVRLLHGLSDLDVPWEKSVQLSKCFSSKNVMVTLVKEGNHRLSEPPHLMLLKKTLCDLMK